MAILPDGRYVLMNPLRGCNGNGGGNNHRHNPGDSRRKSSCNKVMSLIKNHALSLFHFKLKVNPLDEVLPKYLCLKKNLTIGSAFLRV